MSTQQSAQERADSYVESKKRFRDPSGLVYADTDFLAGEESGRKLEREELMAKIEELEAENANQHVIVKHHQANAQAHLNGTSKLEQRITELLADIKGKSSSIILAQKEITTLESQNKKLGDVVLEMADALITIRNMYGATADALMKNEELIATLKQERV